MKTKLSMSGASALRWMNGLLKTACASRLLPLLLLVLTSSATVQALDYTYRTAGGQITITRYVGSSSAVTIPSTINGLPVTTIEYSAFNGLTRLASVTIPSSVTTIGRGAFLGCSSLAAITVDANNSAYGSVDGVLFDKSMTMLIQCPGGKTGNYTIPSSVTSIGPFAFLGCSSLETVALGKSVTDIGYDAFYACTRLVAITVEADNSTYSSVDGVLFNKSQTTLMQYPSGKTGNYTIPIGVTGIENDAFSDCTHLVSVTIPSSVTTIGDDAMYGCTRLVAITVEADNSTYSSVDGVLFNKSQTMLIQCPEGKTGNYTIPSSVTRMGDYAFNGCTSLASVTIPSSVTHIGDYAFKGCTSLASVTIPNSVISIKSGAFHGCTSLASVTIPSSVTTIVEYAFSGCTSLMSVTIPSSVISIEGGAFSDCTSLASVTIPSSVTTIVEYAFSGCTSLMSVTIGNSVTSIGFDAFEGCTGLTTVTIPNGVTSIGGRAFEGCSSLESVAIPNSVTDIGGNAFEDCTGLEAINVDANNPIYRSVDGVLFNKSITILIECPGGKTGNYTIPNSVTTIGEFAFEDCTMLASVTIPSSVTTIGDYAFHGCTSLARVYFEGNAPGLSASPFLFSDSDAVIVYYRAGTVGWGAEFGGQPTAFWIPPPSYGMWVQTTALLTQYPQASAETDDPDQDGMSNYDEMLAGTDPTDRNSVLILERLPRPADLTAEDRSPIEVTQHALYFRSVPGKNYGVQTANILGGPWRTSAVVTATTTQERLIFDKPAPSGGVGFYRVILAQ